MRNSQRQCDHRAIHSRQIVQVGVESCTARTSSVIQLPCLTAASFLSSLLLLLDIRNLTLDGIVTFAK
jgi:hypothetical protein